MDNATMLYRAPGPEKIHGHDVEYTIVDASKVDEHVALGWFRTAVEAGEAHLKALAEAAEREVEDLEDKAAATLEEAHQKLEELGVNFDRRLGLKKLLKLIDDTIAGKTAEPAPAEDSAPQG